MNEIFDKLAAIPLQNILGAGLLAGALYYFSLYDDGSALQAQITMTQQQLDEARTQNAEYKKTLDEKQRMEARLKDLGSKLIEVSKKLPVDLQTIEIAKVIDQVAIETGVRIRSKKPADNVKLDIVEEVPIDVTLEGSYAELGSFIFKISKLDRVTRVKSFKIDSSGDKSGKRLKFDGQIAGYRIIEERKQ